MVFDTVSHYNKFVMYSLKIMRSGSGPDHESFEN